MKIICVELGGIDYNRYSGLEFVFLGVYLFFGTGERHWLRAHIGFSWFDERFYRQSAWNWFKKDIRGERLLEMLMRRLAPGWLDR